MATEVSVSDHPTPIHEEVKEEIHETKLTADLKDSPNPNVEETPGVTEETVEEKKPEAANIEEVKKLDEQEAPTTELPAEETLKTEAMALDNETKSPEVAAEEKKPETQTVKIEEAKPTTEVPSVESKDVEKEPEEAEVAVENPLEEITTKDIEQVADAVAEIAEKKEDDHPLIVEAKQSVPLDEIAVMNKEAEIEEKKEHDAPVAADQKQPAVPLDEIAVLNKEAEIEDKKDECANETVELNDAVEANPTVTEKEVEPVKIDEAESDVKKVEEEKPVEAKDNGTSTDAEKPALEPVKTEAKDEKTVEETKSETTPKEEEKTTPKQSNSLMGKVKKSFLKAKKAFIGKNNTTNKTPEAKEEEKA